MILGVLWQFISKMYYDIGEQGLHALQQSCHWEVSWCHQYRDSHQVYSEHNNPGLNDLPYSAHSVQKEPSLWLVCHHPSGWKTK